MIPLDGASVIRLYTRIVSKYSMLLLAICLEFGNLRSLLYLTCALGFSFQDGGCRTVRINLRVRFLRKNYRLNICKGVIYQLALPTYKKKRPHGVHSSRRHPGDVSPYIKQHSVVWLFSPATPFLEQVCGW